MAEEQQRNGGCGCMPILVLCMIFFVLMCAVAIQELDAMLDDFSHLDPSSGVAAPQRPDPPSSVGQQGHVFNILLIGHDQRDGQAGQRSDSMILCTVDPASHRLVMTSFLRDLYVSIPGHGKNRLNAAYSFGGAPLLKDTLEQNFGIRPDGCVEISFDQFMEVIDLVDGVDIQLTQAEAEHLGGGLKEGMNHLNAQQALDYARIRKLDSDFGRTGRQRKVIGAVLAKMKTLDATRLDRLLRRIREVVTTDLSKADLLAYTTMVCIAMPELQTTSQYIPASGTYRNERIDGMAVLVPDLQANIQILEDTIGS